MVDRKQKEGGRVQPKYIMKVVLAESIKGIGVQKNQNTTRKEAILTATITLSETKKNRVVYTHTANAINSFAVIGQNYYSDVIAEDYAVKEAAHLLAEKIRLLVAAYLETHK